MRILLSLPIASENPFRYGGIARGLNFANREEELRFLKENVRSGQNVVVVSPRRYGKTSLVHRAISQLRSEGVLVAYLDLFRTPTKEQLADDLAQALYDGLVSKLERAARKAAAFFSHLTVSPRLVIGDDGRVSVQFAALLRRQDVDDVIEGLLELPGLIARERERRVALVLDEFQEIVSIDKGLTGVMRSVFQEQDEVAHVFLGSRRHLMEMLFMDKSEHLYRAAKPLPLGPIDPAKFARFVRRRFEGSGVPVAREAVERILTLTGGRPYETQELCSFAWEQARADGTMATLAVVESALDRLLDAEAARYAAVWDGLSPHQRAVLRAVAQEGQGIYSEAYRLRHKLGSASSVTRSIDALAAKELVEGRSGDRVVADVFLGEWLRRTGSERL
jgi:uncharacterized protein